MLQFAEIEPPSLLLDSEEGHRTEEYNNSDKERGISPSFISRLNAVEISVNHKDITSLH